jgi:hypothetical protein
VAHGRWLALNPLEPVVEGSSADQKGNDAHHRTDNHHRFGVPGNQPHQQPDNDDKCHAQGSADDLRKDPSNKTQ